MLYIEFLYDIYKLCSSLSDLCELGFCCSLKNILLIRSIIHICSSIPNKLFSFPFLYLVPSSNYSSTFAYSFTKIDTSIRVCMFTWFCSPVFTHFESYSIEYQKFFNKYSNIWRFSLFPKSRSRTIKFFKKYWSIWKISLFPKCSHSLTKPTI